MSTNRVLGCVVSCVSVVVLSQTLIAQTVELRAVRLNDQAIEPTRNIQVYLGDEFTVEAYVSGEVPTGMAEELTTFQVGLSFGEPCPRLHGTLLPKGLLTRPRQCALPDYCFRSVPVCELDQCVAYCIENRNCPLGFDDCVDGICVAEDPDAFEQFNFVDRERDDTIIPANVPALCADVTNEQETKWGCATFGTNRLNYDGSRRYLGTMTFDVGYDLCRSHRIELVDDASLLMASDGSRFDLSSDGPIEVYLVDWYHCGAVTILDTFPRNARRLPRLKNNAIRLIIDGAIKGGIAGRQDQIYELTNETCPGGLQNADDDLRSNIGSYDLFGFPIGYYSLIVDESPSGVLEHGKWYRFEGLVPPTGGCDLDYCVLVGDADDNGMVNFADLVTIHGGIPTIGADPTDRRDINGDGFINFADLAAAFNHVGSVAPPHPCP